jgi:hypothetical protein
MDHRELFLMKIQSEFFLEDGLILEFIHSFFISININLFYC